MRSFCLPVFCLAIASAQSFVPPRVHETDGYDVDLKFSRNPSGLRAVVVSLGGKDTLTLADLPAIENCTLPHVPPGVWELVITNSFGQAVTRQHISVPSFTAITVTLPEVASAAPPVSWRRLTHKVPRASEKLTRRGIQSVEKGRPDEARDYFTKALAADPDNFEALNRLAFVCIARQDYASAAAYFDRALALDPADPVLLVNSGNALYQLNRFKQSLERATAALRWAPDSPRAHALAGLATLRLRGSREAALHHFQQAKGQLPGVEEIIQRLEAPPTAP